jgi:hypothetical protein
MVILQFVFALRVAISLLTDGQRGGCHSQGMKLGRLLAQMKARTVRGIQGVEDCHRRPALWSGHPQTTVRLYPKMARPQGMDRSGMAGPGETLGSPWILLAIRARACSD